MDEAETEAETSRCEEREKEKPMSSLLTKEEFKRMENEHNKVKFHNKDKKYLSLYLLYEDVKEHVREDSSKPAAKEVKRVMEEMQAGLKKDNEFGGGTIEKCGSFHENTKVGDPNEFDFMYNFELEGYTARKVELTQTKAAKSDLSAKAYYNLYDSEERPILAKDKHEAFRKVVEKNLRAMPWPDDLDREDILVKKGGPAVTFVLLINKDDPKKREEVKIDLTLAIRVDHPKKVFINDETDDTSETDETKRLQLRSWAEKLNDSLLECHFVAAHDYWKLSFATIEKFMMKLISGVSYKGTCYRAIKIMRDSVDVKDTLGDGILSSYPLKVTHLKKTLCTYPPKGEGKDKKRWTKDRVGENVIEMARDVGGGGERHLLKGVFLRDNNIMGESDRSYLEGRRIVNQLKRIGKSYREHGTINTMIWSCLVVCSVIILAVTSYNVIDTDWEGLENKCFPNDKSPPFPLAISFLLVFSVFVSISLLMSCIGVIYAHCFNFIRKRSIFEVLPNLKIIYVVVAITSLVLVIFDVFLVVDFLIDDSCTHLGHKFNIDTSAAVIIALAALPIILVAVSLVVNIVFYEGCKKWSIYDVVMFEFPHCRKHLEPDEPEAQSQNGDANDQDPLFKVLKGMKEETKSLDSSSQSLDRGEAHTRV